jgi:two-component system, OmpR family, phosphate regulon sensor histidine kinase PhoR
MTVTTAAPQLLAKWFRSHGWLVALIGLVLEAAVTIPFGLLDVSAPETSAALAILVAVAVAFAAGPGWGALVATAGWALFFALVVDHAVRAVVALPVWLAVAVLAGLASDRLRQLERERRRDASELDAVRGDATQAIVGFNLSGKILSWDRGAERIYGHSAEDIVGSQVTLLGAEEDVAHILAGLKKVAKGERVDRSHLRQRGRNGEELVVSMSLAPVRDDDGIVAASAVISDATERMHEAERRYRALVEALPVVTLISAPNDRSAVSYASPQVEQLLGYSPTEWQDDPQLFAKLLHPDDKDEVLAGATRKSSSSGPRTTEYRLLARGGGVVWVREEVATVRGPEGKPLYTQTLLIDIGERKRADEERERLLAAEREATARTVERQRRLDFVREAGHVLASSADYRSAIQRVAELAVRDYSDWCVVDVVEDGGPLERVAVARAELLSKKAAAAPDQAPEEAVRRVVETGGLEIVPPLGEASNGRKNGAILGGIDARSAICVPLRAQERTLGALTLARTQSGETYGADDLALTEDLAGRIAHAIDRGRLYRAVEERADAARVVAHVADGVLLVDRRGVVRLWNPAAEAITAIAAGEVLGHSALDAIPGWKDAVDTIPVSTSPDPGQAEVVIPFETDGKERWISISGVNFYGGTVYAFRDLTEVHHLEELKADFIATASHELRTPLAAVYGAAQTLLRHDFALDEGGRTRFISLIADESERLGRIVNEILLANQLDAGRLDLGSEPFEPAEVVERVVEATQVHAPAEVSLKVSAGKELPLVAADKDKVRQVLVNLVENAIKYSPDGGTIEVGVAPHDHEVRFWVSDEGLGIPEGEEQKIFEKFYRLDPQMSRGVGGTGLGLYICNELVTRMGGRIWVEANGTKGSTFLFELQAAEPALASEPRVASVELHGFVTRARRLPHK